MPLTRPPAIELIGPGIGAIGVIMGDAGVGPIPIGAGPPIPA